MPDTWDEAACRARLAAVTPGPWGYYGDVICGVTAQCHCPPDHARSYTVAMEPDRPHEAHDIVSGVAECDVDDETIPDFEQYKRDLQFIANAPADLGAALEEIDRLRAKLDEADGVLAAATSAITEQLNRAVALRRECDRLRAALIRIQEWDCLCPPRQDLLHDLPWLRRLVDEALGAGQGRPDLGGRP
jgi:hypothetical protein